MKYRMLFVALMIPGLGQAAAETFDLHQIQGPFIQELDVDPGDLPPTPVEPVPVPPTTECRPSSNSMFAAYSDEVALENANPMAPLAADPGSIIVIVDEIINIGEKIWKIVEANKPVIEIKRASASAVPSGITCWMDLETWQIPMYRVFEISYKNSLGINVATFKYAVNYTYGGSFSGLGSYLTNVNIVPLDVRTMLGFKVNAEVSIPSVVNMGTRSDPIAGMQIALKFQLESPLKQIEKNEEYFVTGDGEFKYLGQN